MHKEWYYFFLIIVDTVCVRADVQSIFLYRNSVTSDLLKNTCEVVNDLILMISEWLFSFDCKRYLRSTVVRSISVKIVNCDSLPLYSFDDFLSFSIAHSASLSVGNKFAACLTMYVLLFFRAILICSFIFFFHSVCWRNKCQKSFQVK